MNKQFWMALLASLATVWLVNYYFSSKVEQAQPGVVKVGQKTEVAPGQPIRVLSSEDLQKPLALDVAFEDTKFSEPEKIVDVQTDHVKAAFSTYGAVLTSLDFIDHSGKNRVPLRTVYSKGYVDVEQRKKGCFLLALADKTPYIYTLVDKRSDAKGLDVMFKTETAQWILYKTYHLHKDSYQMDVTLGFEPKTTAVTPLKPRLLFAAPMVGEVADDTTSVVVWNEQRQSIDSHDLTKVDGFAWYWTGKPLVGAQDRYFVHALVGDATRFVQRAYVKRFDSKNIFPLLEGPQITQKGEWKLSFYMGPKLVKPLNAVDSRLEELLSFGWLSWLCKLLLELLAWINSFIGNFGLAIILLAILLKLPFMPLSIYSRKQMLHYQHYLPTINKIRLKYRQDMQMQHQELMKFYAEHNISPTTQIVGCLPLLIQLPIMFALYKVLGSYLALYQAPFLGWIIDLSSKDPFYVLPILMGLTMIWQQQVTPAGDGKQRVMMIFLSVFMTIVFANFPAGLVLYWLVNNVLTIGEDYIRKFFFA
jgi:YidC/Oxa1 family membrane protein insertase